MRRKRLILGLILLTPVAYVGFANFERAKLPNGWELASKMDQGRSEIAAAILDNQIYTAGGIGKFRVLKSCEKYDVVNDQWTRCPDLPFPMHHIGIASDGQAIYAGGGYKGLPFNHLPDPPLWQLTGSGWEEFSKLPITVGEHALLGNSGNIYLIGGRTPESDSDQLWQFRPQSGDWTQLAPMPTPRHSFAWVILNGELWVLGGRSRKLGTDIDIVEIYNFESDQWRSGPAMPTGRGGHFAALAGNNIHVLGGEVFDPVRMIKDHDVLDTETGLWTRLEPMARPRHGGVALSMDHKIWLIGGGIRPATHTIYTASPTVQLFSPEKN